MSIVKSLASRRRVLRGLMGGSMVSVGLPLLDCFLDSKGTAMAATGQALPPVFGTWFWGCGLTPGLWEPSTIGKNYDIKQLLKAIEPYKEQVSVFSGMTTMLDGKPLVPHTSGAMAALTGNAAELTTSIDVLVADVIGATTRFRSLEVACTGVASAGFSRRSPTVANPSEVSPAALYTRIFGPEFTDPNNADFKPDPRFMVRRSVLSAITDQRQDLMKKLGASDRARLDEYFVSLRQVETQLEIQLRKPAPLAACSVPAQEEEQRPGFDVEAAMANHRVMSKLLAHALACDQTRVFNVAFSIGASDLKSPHDAENHHQLTHEELIDPKIGYQPKVVKFYEQAMGSFAEMLGALRDIKEGDQTLLDRALVYATSEGGEARVHSLDNMPMMLAGSAGGRVKTGYHVALPGEPVTRVGLTAQIAMGVPTTTWGAASMRTSKAITELLA